MTGKLILCLIALLLFALASIGLILKWGCETKLQEGEDKKNELLQDIRELIRDRAWVINMRFVGFDDYCNSLQQIIKQALKSFGDRDMASVEHMIKLLQVLKEVLKERVARPEIFFDYKNK